MPSVSLRPTQPKNRTRNRVKALMQEEHRLTQTWAERDLKSARETAWEIIPLLRLEASQSKGGGQGAHPVLRIVDTNANSQGEHVSPFPPRFHVVDNPVEHQQTTPTATRPAVRKSSQFFRLRRSFAQQEGGRGSSAEHQAVKGGGGAATPMVTGYQVEPAPLRAKDFRGGLPEGVESLVPFQRRYRGEGVLERRGAGLGSCPNAVATLRPEITARRSQDENRPTPLAQQVLRLEDGGTAGDGRRSSNESGVAVVRVVLEPPPTKKCRCDCALPSGKGNREDCEDFGPQRNLELCEVRGVVRVEAYLPSSSETLTLRVRVPAAASASGRGVEGSAAAETTRKDSAEDALVLPLRIKISTTTRGKGSAAAPARPDRRGTADAGEGRGCERVLPTVADAGHEEECRSRKQQRRLLWEARATERRRGAAEMLAAVQGAISDSHVSLLARKSAGTATQQHGQGLDKHANGGQPKSNSAFGMLLIRANAIVPIERLSLASGSWREAIGELVGCPAGQGLRAVRFVTWPHGDQ